MDTTNKFGNYDIPSGAVLHEEEHDENEEEEHHEEDMGFLNNSDYAADATKFGISKVGDWGYVGISVDNLEVFMEYLFMEMNMKMNMETILMIMVMIMVMKKNMKSTVMKEFSQPLTLKVQQLKVLIM